MLWPFHKRLGPNQPLKQTKELYTMKRNTLFSFLTVAALGLLTAGPANAQCTFTWTGATNDNFREAGNWTKSGSCVNNWPLTGNIAIFPNVDRDVIINDQNEQFGELRIENGGLVTITGQTLTLDGAVTHDLDGNLVLWDSTAIVKFTADATVGGDAAIVGQHDSAKIQIEGGDTLTNEMSVKGQLTIETNGGSGDGTFVNGSTGVVWANAGGTLLMDGSLTLDDNEVDGARALWKATNGSSTFLQFASGLTFVDSNDELQGDFVLCGNATLDFDVQTRTSGCFDETVADGWVRVAGTNFFCHNDSNCAAGGGEEKCYSSDTEFMNSCS